MNEMIKIKIRLQIERGLHIKTKQNGISNDNQNFIYHEDIGAKVLVLPDRFTISD